MATSCNGNDETRGGILIQGVSAAHAVAEKRSFLDLLDRLALGQYVETYQEPQANGPAARFSLRREFSNAWAPDFDTMQLRRRFDLGTGRSGADLEREILLAMLLGPCPFRFPSCAELLSAIRIRQNIVAAARSAELSFHTSEAERPADYWTYAKGRGFTLLPGKSLIAALKTATQPDASGTRYGFSCYRATEYVILLGAAQELMVCNPDLLARLQRHWESRPIMSGEFHQVFLREYGSMAEPLPLKYYVPGDRVWFRNPDADSSDATGYEGSWVLYLGGGLFNNFWKSAEPYTLTSKCLEIYQWRNATFRDAAGELRMDEAMVEQRVRESIADPSETQRILRTMLRHREPSGVYGNGGCIDTTREYLRWVCAGTSDLLLPEL